MQNKKKVVRTILADQVHQILQERILDQQYLPGERLNIDTLARELGTSSSPVREALARLSAEGLVSSSSFMGFSVAPIRSRQWYEQMVQYRILIEGWAAREAARLRPAEPLEAMAKSLEILESGCFGPLMRNFDAANKADQAFHIAMMEAAGNQVIIQAIRDLRPHLHHARLFSKVHQDIGPTASEHRRILDAIVRGDEDEAAIAVEDHLMTAWSRYDEWTSEE